MSLECRYLCSLLKSSCSPLIRCEAEIEKLGHDRLINHCIKLASHLSNYVQQVGDAYESNPLEMSSFILNIFDLWRLLDMYACKVSPFLAKHHPIFTAELLDCLQLPNSQDMLRLQIVQDYLRQRVSKSSLSDILSHCDSEHSFPYRAFKRCPGMQKVESHILLESREKRKKKEQEWTDKADNYEKKMEFINDIELCSCPNGKRNRFSKEDVKNRTVCERCRAFRAKDAISISVHEDFLPTSRRIQRAAIVFELELPQHLGVYREMTWSIIRDLAHPTWPKMDKKSEPNLLFQNFLQLQRYMARPAGESLTLASVSKSFLQTHYKVSQFKQLDNREEVLLGFGPDFHLYDVQKDIWVENFDRDALTFEHLCGVHIPSALDDIMPHAAHPPMVLSGPSSYQLLANQTRCPQNVPLHEFSACQRLLFGSSQRWVNILVELGSSNLNFSNADTVKLLVELATRAGPPGSSGAKRLREAFEVFEDPAFCDRLAEQIRTRLCTIKSNWRESNCLSLMIVLSECLVEFGQYSAGKELLASTRQMTLDWIRQLRQESLNVKERDASSISAIAVYAFKAAILCRRTFSGETSVLSETDIGAYCEASIALYHNTPATLEGNWDIKAMMIHDTKMTHRISQVISQSLQRYSTVLNFAVTQAWPFSKTYKFAPWSLCPSAPGWISTRLGVQGSKFISFHTVHFNYLEGFLLLDSKPLGGLPTKIRNSQVVTQLFGNAALPTVTSNRNGMLYQLVNYHEGNEVYFGIRHAGTSNETVVLQLRSGRHTVEFVPREVFTRGSEFDFPLKLRDKSCVHFLNYTTGCLEFRRIPKIWNSRAQDWVLDLGTRTCQRGRFDKISRLLNQESTIGRYIAQSFHNFEKPECLLAFVSSKGRAHVEVNRFELTFFINHYGLLQDNKWNMEFDENQDAGTFYGLLSQIVLRDVKNHTKRSVIVPLGDAADAQYRLRDLHPEIFVINASYLGKFDIDHILGRLVTPPEPALVFAKAYYHALTSSPIPDPLTSRTGIEEAFHILRSGAAQPWQSLGGLPLKYLDRIAQLSPKRQFYPEDQRRLQTVHWDPELPVFVQHDHLDALVQNLIHKSQQLMIFEQNKDAIEPRPPRCILRTRGEHERVLYEPRSLHPSHHSASDQIYHSRDIAKASCQAQNVANITRCLFDPSFILPGKIDLKAILLQQQVLGGFDKENAFACSLSKLFSGEVFDQWGQLIQYSVDADPSRPYNIAFSLALLAFHKLDDMHRVLAAFVRIEALKALQLPDGPSFSDLEVIEPGVDKFTNLIKQVSPEFVLRTKQRVQVSARLRHENQCQKESRLLAEYFVSQWPTRQLKMTESAPAMEMLDLEEAFDAVLATWERFHHNRELFLFVANVQAILDKHATNRPLGPMASTTAQNTKSQHKPTHFSGRRSKMIIPNLAQELLPKITMRINDPEFIPSPRQLVKPHPSTSYGKETAALELRELGTILKNFSQSKDPIRRGYGEDLLKSLAALEKVDDAVTESWDLKDAFCSVRGLQRHMIEVDRLISEQRTRIVSHLNMCDSRHKWLRLGGLWPGTGTVTLLEQLRSSLSIDFGTGMKEALVHFGLLITLRQWLGRVCHEFQHGNARKLEGLLKTTGHENWNPMDRPDWLLMEIEADLLIRPHQVNVANQLISPTSQQNSLTQLMMGEGECSHLIGYTL